MSETNTFVDKTIRKIRKKLRQIEHLKMLDRELNDEELSKVIIRSSLRKELFLLLEENYPDEAAAMKRTGSYLPPKKDVKKARSSTADESKEDIKVKEEVKDDTKVVTASDDELSVPAPKVHQQMAVDHVENMNISVNVVATPRSPIHKETITTSINNDTALDKSKHKDTQISLPKTQISLPKTQINLPKTQISLPKTKEIVIENKIKTDAKKVTKKDTNPHKNIKSIWKDSEYHIYNLEGHNDLVISVDCTEEYIISGSRDTMIKVWRVGATNEERTLRGHKSPVTGVSILRDTLAAKTLSSLKIKLEDSSLSSSSASCAILAVSVGLDCTLNLWDIVSGENHGSHYTYNGMTALGCGSWGVVVGTEGGKLEVWCLSSGQRLAVASAFQSQVTTITVVDENIFVGSMEGEVGVWKFDQQNNSLVSQYLMDPESSTYIPLRKVSALSAYKGVMYLGDTGPNIKTLDWKYGISGKLVNHLGSMGMTDSSTVHESGHLLSSSYHMDSGYPSVNVRDLSNGSYICSLLDNDEGRYLTMASATNVFVTGGHLLKVWKRLHKGSKTSEPDSNMEIVIPSWLPSLSQCAEDSSDDETDWASSSEDEDMSTHNGTKRRTSDKAVTNGSSQGSSWWCVIM